MWPALSRRVAHTCHQMAGIAGSVEHMTKPLIGKVALVAGATVLFGYVLLPVRLQGISMLPTYDDGRLNFANRLAYWRRDPGRAEHRRSASSRPACGSRG